MKSESTPVGKKQKCRSIWDKLLLGVVVGGAVGSIVGVALAPDKGSKTRQKVRGKIQSIMTHNKPTTAAKPAAKRGVWHWLHDLLVRKK